jgi:ribosomal-protein-alanine N-acetyltransferase
VLSGVSGELIGYFCVGDEARVAGLDEQSGVADVGVAMRPDLRARGDTEAFGTAVLTHARQLTGSDRFRATVRRGNSRGLLLLGHLGFHPVSRHGPYLVLTG